MAKRKPHAPRVLSPPRVPRPSPARIVIKPPSFDEPLEVPLPAALAGGHDLEPNCRAFRLGECFVLVGQSPRSGWHLSISHPTRIPTWEELRSARYRLLPDDLTMGVLLPPSAQYVNLHPFCLHLWQIGQPSGKARVLDPRGKSLGVEIGHA